MNILEFPLLYLEPLLGTKWGKLWELIGCPKCPLLDWLLIGLNSLIWGFGIAFIYTKMKVRKK